MQEEDPLLKKKQREGEGEDENFYEYDWKTTCCISGSLVYCFIVCGLVTVALGAALEDLASNVGCEPTAIGTIYVARGVGSVLGSVMSFYIFEYLNAVRALIVNEMLTVLVSLSMPFITHLWVLHMAYFMIGGVTSILQAGAMLLLRKVHKEKAGPWLSAFGACFVSAGIIVPAVQLAIPVLTIQFALFSVVVLLGACWLLSIPPLREDVHSHTLLASTPNIIASDIESSSNNTLSTGNLEINSHDNESVVQSHKAPHYWAEMVVGAMIFFAVGGGDSLTFYLETYVDSSVDMSGCNKNLLLLLFFAFATLGDVIGIFAQLNITDALLSAQTATLFIAGGLSMLVVIMYPVSASALYVGVSIFGFCNAPSISYCFNLAHRLSYPSATSTSIVMFGLSVGISTVPYLTSLAWRVSDSPLALMHVGFLSCLLPVVLLFIAPAVSYLKAERSFISLF